MSKKIVYLLGAGASANALPVVGGLKDRFKLFCNHFFDQVSIRGIDSFYLQKAKADIDSIVNNLESHYTIDTYAKKLYLQGQSLGGDKGYIRLKRYLSAFFLYEQIIKSKEEKCFEYFKNIYHPVVSNVEQFEDPNIKLVDGILKDFDYRYDSFFASVLVTAGSQIILPENISLVSWNYDYQIEKAFINFTNKSLHLVQKSFEIFGSFNEKALKDDENYALIKLNGTAGFKNGIGNKDVVNFKSAILNDDVFEILIEILLKEDYRYFDGVRFAWENDNISSEAVRIANNKMKEADIIVIIGYSFPYFNREVDRQIFKGLENIGTKKIYLQAPPDSIESIANRFKAIFSRYEIEKHTEIDQFLIPNEF